MVTFYATLWADGLRPYMPTVPVLLPASSWARFGLSRPRLPDRITERAADCGGFVATMRWGDYRYTPAEYTRWCETWGPQWAAMMDYCCEDEITSGKPGIVRRRQDQTTEMAWHFWHAHRDVPWCWVPTVQGWHDEEYVRHAREIAPLIAEMQEHYGPSAFRVGIGTLCRRRFAEDIVRVVDAVAAELPGVPLHLWGIKLATLRYSGALPATVTSVDSAAWNSQFPRQRDAQKSSGMSKMEWSYKTALPAYLAKVEAALGETRQMSIFGQGG